MSTMRRAILTVPVFLLLLATSCCCFRQNPSTPSLPREYTVRRIPQNAVIPDEVMNFWTDTVAENWEEGQYFFWKNADLGTLSYVHPNSKYKGSRIEFKLLHDGKRIYAIFRAEKDKYVIARKIRRQSFTCKDTCAEIFLAPGQTEGGYCNLEVSLSGEFLYMYHKGQETAFKDFGYLPEEDTKNVHVYTSADGIVIPEIKKSTQWHIIVVFDAATIAKYAGVEIPEDLSGQTWNANFYHCAEASSHPRWLAWNPISRLSFHLPNCFGKLHFE